MPVNNPSAYALLIAATSDSKISVERIVRGVTLAAKAMGDVDMIAWCAKELNGYTDLPVPSYRDAAAMPKAIDSFGTRHPLFGNSESIRKVLTTCPIMQSLAEVESSASAGDDAEFEVSFVPTVREVLLKATKGARDVIRVIQRGAYEAVLSGARQHVFKWAVENSGNDIVLASGLRMQDILGLPYGSETRDAGMPPKPMEMTGGIDLSQAQLSGPVQIVMGSPGAQASLLHNDGIDMQALSALAEVLNAIVEKGRREAPAATDVARVAESLAEVRALIALDRPQRSWVKGTLQSLRAVAEGASGSILGELAKPHVQALIGQVLRSIGAS